MRIMLLLEFMSRERGAACVCVCVCEFECTGVYV